MRKCLCSASSPSSHLPATLSLFTFLQASIATSLAWVVKETPREQLTRYILELPVRIILKTWAQVTIKQTEKLPPARILIMESLLMCVCIQMCVSSGGGETPWHVWWRPEDNFQGLFSHCGSWLLNLSHQAYSANSFTHKMILPPLHYNFSIFLSQPHAKT